MSNIRKANEFIKAVLYLRLSNEDEGKLTKEELSESIKNQELMLTNYAHEQGYEIVGIYNDEDWSGADCTRPQFNKMIKECEKGNVDVVIAKTQSRFARDMELIEKYLHNKFIEWNVQFQTVVDRIDNTKRETKKTSQILGLTDEWYLEDTSLNIRETFKTKRENGEFTGSFAPYGYDKDPENKNHLVIDPVAAEVVKRIYDEFLSGKGYKTIARIFNEELILSPLEYKYMKGQNLQIPFISNYMYFDSVTKAGMYKINVSYTNETRQVLHNIISYSMLTTDKKIFSNKCKIQCAQIRVSNLVSGKPHLVKSSQQLVASLVRISVMLYVKRRQQVNRDILLSPEMHSNPERRRFCINGSQQVISRYDESNYFSAGSKEYLCLYCDYYINWGEPNISLSPKEGSEPIGK